jgi:hypothetical protein
MRTFVTLTEILEAAYTTDDIDYGIDCADQPQEWHYGSQIDIESVNLWEKIYYQPQDIGIYAAYDPYIEYYIIVPYQFVDFMETYIGTTASEQAYKRAREIGINLEVNRVWTNLEKF